MYVFEKDLEVRRDANHHRFPGEYVLFGRSIVAKVWLCERG